MKLMIIGDIVGKGGRKAVNELVPDLRREFNCSFIIANCENIANGAGLTAKCLKQLEGTINVATSGDHTWIRKALRKKSVALIMLSGQPISVTYNQAKAGAFFVTQHVEK